MSTAIAVAAGSESWIWPVAETTMEAPTHPESDLPPVRRSQYVPGASPVVTVAVTQANSARFYVIGQVGKSGEFPLSGPTTVLQALALAGGFKDFAKTDGIVIVRKDQTVVPVNYKRIADGKDVAQNVLLAPGDTIVVP